MCPECVGLSAHVLQCGQLTQLKTRVEYQSHTCSHLVFSYDSILKDTQFLQLKVIGIGVIAHAVLVGKEGLTGILCANDASLDVGTIVKLIAQRVTIAVSQIAVSVALSFVEGNMTCGHHRVFAVFHDVMKGGKVGLLPGYFAHIGEKRQQGYLLIVE